MSESEIADILDLILESVHMVQERFSRITVPEDFVSTPEGVILSDAISMRLQVIGESVKRIQKIDSLFLVSYSEINWDKMARFRDLVSHHYEHVDYEIVYDICKNHIPRLRNAIQKMIDRCSKMELSLGR